jgi:AraC-like DNA-binding protein
MPLRQGIELFVGYLFRILQELLGPSWKPRRVLFMHSAPASLTRHVAMFGRIVDFDAEFNGIACAAEDLAGPLPSADPVMARYARQYLDAVISRPDMTLADKVRWLVRDMLPLGRCSVDKVAQHLNVDRRTVHRHLAHSGETFSSLVDDVRGELAEGYLEGNKSRLTDVADLLGFSAPSALSRWHKRHFGFTLTERRSGK